MYHTSRKTLNEQALPRVLEVCCACYAAERLLHKKANTAELGKISSSQTNGERSKGHPVDGLGNRENEGRVHPALITCLVKGSAEE